MEMDIDMKKNKQRTKRTTAVNTSKTSKPLVSPKSSNSSVLSNTSSYLIINGKMMSDKARNITLVFKYGENGKLLPVKGLADTGKDFNVTDLTTMKKFMIIEEQPQYIKNVTFMDKKPIPLESVVVTHVVLFKNNWKLVLKE
eukprot:snap_masked-scaffold_9-processed-gene-13.48-mRNA-1 protein AED:1.00 eAED:1.00 QI:0/-1/0/0/-1/1/1/0/141